MSPDRDKALINADSEIETELFVNNNNRVDCEQLL